MVKGSGSVGMWSTCKVVHHVHAVGALVHQAEQAHPLHARCTLVLGGLGGVSPACIGSAGRDGGQAERRTPDRLAGLVSVSTTCRTPKSLSTMRASGYLAGAMPA